MNIFQNEFIRRVIVDVFLITFIGAAYGKYLEYRYVTRQALWNIKRDACFEALKIAEASLSNMKWQNLTPGENANIGRQDINTIKARECYDNLASTCDSPEVLDNFKKALGAHGAITPDIIVDLRNAVRKELGFRHMVDSDRKTAFFARLIGDEK